AITAITRFAGITTSIAGSIGVMAAEWFARTTVIAATVRRDTPCPDIPSGEARQPPPTPAVAEGRSTQRREAEVLSTSPAPEPYARVASSTGSACAPPVRLIAAAAVRC